MINAPRNLKFDLFNDARDESFCRLKTRTKTSTTLIRTNHNESELGESFNTMNTKDKGELEMQSWGLIDKDNMINETRQITTGG